MLVADLYHFLDLAPDTPGPARRLGEHLAGIVAAATAGDAHTAWETALPCRRRPANRRCPGHIIVICTQPDTSIGWHCSLCGDDGTISNWAGSPFDLRRQRLALTEPVHEIAIDDETAAILRTLSFLDIDCQRAVFAIRARGNSLHLALTDTDLDELIGAVAAEANHEPNRRRQQRLDARTGAYPLQQWGWTRADALQYILDVTGGRIWTNLSRAQADSSHGVRGRRHRLFACRQDEAEAPAALQYSPADRAFWHSSLRPGGPFARDLALRGNRPRP